MNKPTILDQNGSLLLVLPVPFRRASTGLFFELQACNGLEQWARNFERVTVACPVMPENIASQDKSIQWIPVDGIPSLSRIKSVELPWAYDPVEEVAVGNSEGLVSMVTNERSNNHVATGSGGTRQVRIIPQLIVIGIRTKCRQHPAAVDYSVGSVRIASNVTGVLRRSRLQRKSVRN